MDDYVKFIERKSQAETMHGFEPLWLPDFLFPFQRDLVSWSLRKGRAAIFADCGMGKSPMELVWGENVARKTGKRVLLLTPLAVGAQMVREGEKFGRGRANEGREATGAGHCGHELREAPSD